MELQQAVMKASISSMTVREIKEFLRTIDNPQEWLEELEADKRSSVRKLVERVKREMAVQKAKRLRIRRLYRYQRWVSKECEISVVVGVDEVGRGPLAGPVVAAAVGLPLEPVIAELDDSKRLTDAQRRELNDLICRQAVCLGIGQSSPEEIDRLDIRKAALLAMRRAVEQCNPPSKVMVIVDGKDVIPGLGLRQRAVVRGDARIAAVAAASIVAKVYRDDLMIKLDEKYPQYGFASHKGYPTPSHLAALRRYGLTPEHRKSFSPCHGSKLELGS